MTEIEACKIYNHELKIKGHSEKKLTLMQQKFLKKPEPPVDLNSSIGDIKKPYKFEKSKFISIF